MGVGVFVVVNGVVNIVVGFYGVFEGLFDFYVFYCLYVEVCLGDFVIEFVVVVDKIV